MKKQAARKSLQLHRETIQNLTTHLKEVAGRGAVAPGERFGTVSCSEIACPCTG